MAEFEILSELLQRLIEVINNIITRYVIIYSCECRFLCPVNLFIFPSQPAYSVESPSARQRNAIQMAFRWQADGVPLLDIAGLFFITYFCFAFSDFFGTLKCFCFF